MPRRKQFGKRKLHHNQYFLKNESKECAASDLSDVSASKRKLDCSENDDVSNNYSYEGSTNIIIDLEILSTVFNTVAKCKNCNASNCFDVLEEKNSCKGIASSLLCICKFCGNSSSAMTSKISKEGYDVNNRLVYAMRCIGKGRCAARTFCAVMNLPPPPAKFEKFYDSLTDALSSACTKSMIKAVEEAVSSNDNVRDISVALDGSWQKRGHTSMNGVVTATSMDNGKVIDFECLTKYCFKCKNKRNDCNECQKNFNGFSGGMESEGAVRIFQRSLTTRNVCYSEYLGDGDSKGFLKICEAKVYGEKTVRKLECIGHVQKRMGARLKALRNELKSTKLSDGKKISGRGRLTDAEILQIQKYYGLAIRRNTLKSVEEMSKAIWAIYFHKLSTDDKPQHGLCPTGSESWCGFNSSLEIGEKYTHKHSLPEAVLLATKQIFRDLTNKELLSKCLHGRTQNPNESFNNCVWERIPKNTFVGLKTLKIGVMDAVLCFNDGVISRIEVLKNLGITPGRHTCDALKKIDRRRVNEAEIKFQKTSKEARTLKRHIKRVSELHEMCTQDEYGPGRF